MNTLPPTAAANRALRPDDMDRLLSAFFKAEIDRPWPPSPGSGRSEPSELVASRSTDLPRNRTHSANSGRSARVTLVASVAILVGSCWYLSNSWQPSTGPSTTPSATAPSGTDLLRGAATANETGVLPEVRKEKAKASGE